MAQVRRVRALRVLDEAGDRRLTLVIAPAGFGKSSLMNQHFEDLRKGGHQAAWVSLEAEDSDGTHFLLSVLGALAAARVIPATAQDYSGLSRQHILGVILTHLQRLRRPLHLFLDDYHFARSDDNDAALARLLFSTQARNLRLLIISRSEPGLAISAMQLSGQLAYLKAGELRFSPAEAQTLFALAGVKLEKSQVERLVERTDGWAVALQLARVLLKDGVVNQEDLLEFSGSQTDMARYLSEQVFSSLSSQMQDALIGVSALPHFSSELAGVVVSRSAAAELMSDIAVGGLPIEAFDDGREQFKLHAVFQEFLQQEALSRGIDINHVRRIAARWYADRGDWSNAIRHALLAGDFLAASRFSENAGGWKLVYAGARGLLQQFHALAAVLPEQEAGNFPRTFLGLAVAAAKGGNLTVASYYFDLVAQAVERSDKILLNEVRLIEALMALYRDDRIEASDLSLLERDLTMLALAEPVQRGLTCNLLCFQYLERSEFERAERYGSLAIQFFGQANAHFGAMHLHVHVGQARYFRGDMEGASAAYERLTTDAQAAIGKGSDLDALGQVLLAETMSERGFHGDAERILEWALPHIEKNDCWFDLLAAAYLTRIRARMIANDTDGVDAVLEQGRRTAQRRGFPRLKRLIEREQMRSIIQLGDIEGAKRFADRFDLGPETAFDAERNRLSIRLRGEIPATLWVRIWMQEGRNKQALDMLRRLETAQEQPYSVPRKMRMRLLEVMACMNSEDSERSFSVLDEILLTLPSADYRAAFFEEGTVLLALMRRRADQAGPDSVIGRRIGQIMASAELPGSAQSPAGRANDPATGSRALTQQELNVLSLICGGFSNKEIAKYMGVSENTVKFHIRNIFSKLNVHSRTSAISAARELGLLA